MPPGRMLSALHVTGQCRGIWSKRSTPLRADSLPILDLALRLHQTLELLDDERRLPLAARFAKLLLRWPVGPDNHAAIVATQQQLADELAVSRVALSGALRQLVSEDLVETGYKRIRLPARNRLEQWVAMHSQLSQASNIA